MARSQHWVSAQRHGVRHVLPLDVQLLPETVRAGLNLKGVRVGRSRTLGLVALDVPDPPLLEPPEV